MPDFDFVVVSGGVAAVWDDARLNHRPIAPHLYRRVVAPVAPAIAEVVIQCIVDGDPAPLDTALDGRLFFVSRVSWSGSYPFGIVQAPGQSSLITLRFAHNMLGHQEVAIRRPEGGALIFALDVES